MYRSFLIRAVLMSLALAALAACADDAGFQVRVVKIFDGDSFLMRRADGMEMEIRLFGIDAPERHQPWSRRSREALRKMIRDRNLRVQSVAVDAYGRTVAIVTLPDGEEVSAAMVRDGHAWVYRRYTDDPAMIRLEEAAREQRRGLWSLPAPERIPPWVWRRKHRKQPDGAA